MASVFRSHDGIYFVSWNWLPLKLTVSELILNYEIVDLLSRPLWGAHTGDA